LYTKKIRKKKKIRRPKGVIKKIKPGVGTGIRPKGIQKNCFPLRKHPCDAILRLFFFYSNKISRRRPRLWRGEKKVNLILLRIKRGQAQKIRQREAVIKILRVK
jgi:hypothetical protein